MANRSILLFSLGWICIGLLTILLLMAPCKQSVERFTVVETPKKIDHVIQRIERNYLTEKECSALIQLAHEKGFEPSRVVAEGKSSGVLDKEVRQSEQVWLNPEHHTQIQDLYRRVSKLTGMPTSHMEDLQVLRYQSPPGGFYKHHYDDCQDHENCTEFWKDGGRRLYTVIIYLNGSDSGLHGGGETDFPRLGIRVRPERGKLAWWRNLGQDGKVELDSLHAGLPLEGESVKYMANIWIRQQPRADRKPF